MSTEICFFSFNLIDQFNHELINQKLNLLEKKTFSKTKTQKSLRHK